MMLMTLGIMAFQWVCCVLVCLDHIDRIGNVIARGVRFETQYKYKYYAVNNHVQIKPMQRK